MAPHRTTPQTEARLVGRPAGMLFALITALAVVMLIFFTSDPPSNAAPLQPERLDQHSSLTRAVFADGRLWGLTDAGVLFSLAEGENRPVRETLPEPAFDLCVEDGQPLVVTGGREAGAAWTLRRRTADGWMVRAAFPRQDERPIGMVCEPEGTTVLTTTRLVSLAAGRPRSLPLIGRVVRFGVTHTAYATPEFVFIGTNAGEWGGGLHRISRVTGDVTRIQKQDGDLCGTPLDPECDPVNGIAPLPWKPGCVAAAVGLVHMRPHGRIVEVCGTDVRRIYVKAYDMGSDHENRPEPGRDEPFNSVAFYGLQARGDTLWAVGIDGVYRFRNDALLDIRPLPEFKAAGDLRVSFEDPDMVLVLTDVSRRASMGSSTPMMAVRGASGGPA